MVKYWNFDVVFAEIPDEVTLAINITGCPNRCPGCHSPHLREDAGICLDDDELRSLLDRYGSAVTCVCFMGGDADPCEIARLASVARAARPGIRVGWYSGRSEVPEGVDERSFDYIKLGDYVEASGPLNSPTTNQRLYRILPGGGREDMTHRFLRNRL